MFENVVKELNWLIRRHEQNIVVCQDVYDNKILKGVKGYENHRALQLIEHSKKLITEYQAAIASLKGKV